MRIRGSLVAIAIAAGAVFLSAPAAHAIQVSISVKPAVAVWGTTFTLSGTTDPNTQVMVERRIAGDSEFRSFSGNSVTSAGDGTWSLPVKPNVNTDYRANAGSAISQIVRALVRVGVTINEAESAGRAVFFGTVASPHPFTKVYIQYFNSVSRTWQTVRTAGLSGASQYRIAYFFSGPHRLFRTAWPTQDTDHTWNISRSIWVSLPCCH